MNYGVWKKPEEDAWHSIYCWGEIDGRATPRSYLLIKRFQNAKEASDYCIRLNDEYRIQRLKGDLK